MPHLLLDPDETKTVTQSWTAYLSDGDHVSTSSWSVSPSGPTLSGATTTGNWTTSVKISGGTSGVIYNLINTVTTAALSQTLQKQTVLRCQNI